MAAGDRFDEVDASEPLGILSQHGVIEPGKHNQLDVRVEIARQHRDLEPIKGAQPDVGYQDVERLLLEELSRFFEAAARPDVLSGLPERALHRVEQWRIVIDNQNPPAFFSGHGTLPLAPASVY
jgi:hypothetical protein